MHHQHKPPCRQPDRQSCQQSSSVVCAAAATAQPPCTDPAPLHQLLLSPFAPPPSPTPTYPPTHPTPCTQGMYFEATGREDKAEDLYRDFLKEQPSCDIMLKRLVRAMPG